MTIDLSALRTYILANYADDAAARKDGTIAAALNAESGTRYVSTFINERTVLAAFQDPAAGETLLQKLEAAAQGNAVVARVLRWMKPAEGGIDIGHASTQAMLASLVSAEVITQGESDALTALAAKPSSVAIEQFGAPVTVAQVSAALNQG